MRIRASTRVESQCDAFLIHSTTKHIKLCLLDPAQRRSPTDAWTSGKSTGKHHAVFSQKLNSAATSTSLSHQESILPDRQSSKDGGGCRIKMETPTRTSASPILLEVAIVGSGPAGMACLKEISKQCPHLLMSSRNVDEHETETANNDATCGSIDNGNNQGRIGSSPRQQHLVAVFEETSSIGGLWNRQQQQRPNAPCHCYDSSSLFSNDGGSDNDIITKNKSKNESKQFLVETSSQPVYENLITNLPKDLCSFSDYPYPSEWEFLLPAEKVNEYYQNYFDIKHPHLKQYVHLNTRVEQCWKEKQDDDSKSNVWTIRTTTTTTATRTSDSADQPPTQQIWNAKRLVVCNGHFRKAYVPNIDGLRYYPGTLMHSSAFDTPKNPRFHDKTILIVGGMASGTDIAGFLVTYGNCKRIIVSVRKSNPVSGVLLSKLRKMTEDNPDCPCSLVFRRGISHIDEAGFVHFVQDNDAQEETLSNSLTEKPDIIIFGTGYRYYYPFLPTNEMKILRFPEVDHSGYKMERLYKRILYLDDPTVAFIGIPNLNFSPLLVIEYQSQWYVHMILKKDQETFDRWITANKDCMGQEIESRKDDTTQDVLFKQVPSYCTSLARDVGVDGYWMQLLKRRIPLHIRSLWVRRHPIVYWISSIAATVVVIPVLSFLYR